MKIIETKDLLQHTELLEKNNVDVKLLGTIHGSQLEYLKNIYVNILDTSEAIPGGVAELKSFKGIRHLTLPECMEEIRDFDFSFCPVLESIYLAKNIKSIGIQAFSYSNKLKNIEVAEDNEYYTSVDGIIFDKSKTTLVRCPEGIAETYTIPEGTERIGANAFYGCNELKHIYMPSSIREIGEGAFQRCEGLLDINIPERVKRIEKDTFFGCSKLSSVILPDNLLEIGKGAFNNCESLENIELPQKLTTFDKAFENCNKLASISIKGNNGIHYYSKDGVVYDKEKKELVLVPFTIKDCTIAESIENIGPRAFESTLISKIVFSKSVRNLKEMSFRGCYNLLEISLPQNTSKIEDLAFDSCTNLRRIECNATVPPCANMSSFSFMPLDETIIEVPKQSVESYKKAEGWNLFKNIVAQG